MSRYVVNSAGPTRAVGATGAAIATRSWTDEPTGVRLTLDASASVRIFTAQRSTPQPSVSAVEVNSADFFISSELWISL